MAISTWKKQRFIYLSPCFVVIILLAALGYFFWNVEMFGRISVGALLLSLDVVFVSWLAVAVFGRVLHNNWAILIFLGALLLFGFCVYGWDCGPLPVADNESQFIRVLYPIVNTLSIFFPSRGDYSLGGGHSAQYYLLHFLGYLFAVWFLFSMFGSKMISRTLCLLIREKKKCVFWGYSEGGVMLARDMLSHSEFCQPVFVLSDKTEYDKSEESKIFDELMDFGAIVVHADFDEKLKISGVRHFFMTENQDENVSLALKMIDQLNECGDKTNLKKYLHVRTEIEGIDALFQAKYNANKELNDKVEVNIFSQSDLAARSFVMNHHLLKLVDCNFKPLDKKMTIHTESATVSGECNVLLLGLGWSGYELLRKTVCDAQFLGGDFHFSVTVIDDDFQTNRGRYLRIFDAARRMGIEINVNPTVFLDECGRIVAEDRIGLAGYSASNALEKRNISSVNGCDFYRWLDFNDNILDFDRIIVSLGNDELNTNTAMQLHRFRLNRLDAYHTESDTNMPEKIFVHINDCKSYNFYQETSSPIVPFGDLKEINSVDTLVREKMDRVAKAVNYVYSKKERLLTVQQFSNCAAIEEEWDKNDTDIFSQNSSRSVALNIANIVKIAGGIQSLQERLKDKSFLEKCAEMEHKRWNAYNLMCGIDTLKQDETKDKRRKLLPGGTLTKHVCIVDFDELSEKDKETDRKIVNHFPIFFDMLNTK